MSGAWKNCTLGEVITLQRGFDLPKQQRDNGEVPIVSSSGISGTHNIAKVSAPGVVTGRYGTLGKSFYITKDFWPLNTTLFVRDFKGNEPRFISYLLKTLGFENQNVAGAVPGVNRNFLHMLPVKLPPLDQQVRISSILSAYDDLIESNTRRIRILEEMAQSLYREWFVHFRFPGHEKVKLVNSSLGKIPEGWEIVRVEELVNRIPSGKKYDSKTVTSEGLIPVLDQGRSGIIGFHDDAPGIFASDDSPVIVFANHTCYQRIIQFPFSAIQNVLPFIPSPQKYRDIYWLHWATKDIVAFNDYKGHWPEFIGKKILLPPTSLCRAFGGFVENIVKNVYKIEKISINLRHSRDLLLPKLISGDIEL